MDEVDLDDIEDVSESRLHGLQSGYSLFDDVLYSGSDPIMLDEGSGVPYHRRAPPRVPGRKTKIVIRDGDSLNTDKYLQPLPIWRSDGWLGLRFGQVQTEQGVLWQIALVFAGTGYARKVFEAIAAWNDGDAVDRDNRIGISLITEPSPNYTAYIYPTLEGVTLATPVQTAMLARPFPNPPGSHLRRFLSAYHGAPFQLTAVAVSGDSIQQVPGITPVWKHHLKAATRASLTERDREYHHGRRVIDPLRRGA